jgi:hypothetical protein
LIFFDPEIENYAHWNDRDKSYADSFFSQYNPENRTLIIAGNLHTAAKPFELATKEKAESGTLYPLGYHLIQKLGNFPIAKIFYHSGSYLNFGVKSFPKSVAPVHMLRKRKTEPMRYEIHLESASPAESF